MSKLDKDMLRKLIMQELASMGEEKLISPIDQAKELDLDVVYHYDEGEACEHGNEGQCYECGQVMYECSCQDAAGMNDYSLDSMSGDLGMVMNIMGDMDMSGPTPLAPDTKQHYHGAYMSKSQLYKIAKYAEKLYNMIPKGYDLEDWMRSKLSSIADDISEVYHALDHDKFEGDL